MHLYVVLLCCLFGNVRKAGCQGSAKDVEGDLSVGSWSSLCSGHDGNCNRDQDEDEGEDDLTETDELEADIYSEYDPDYGDFIMVDEEPLEDGTDEEESSAKRNLEDPIEEVEPFSHSPMTASERWAQEMRVLHEDEYEVDEECEPISNKRRQRKREKWKKRRRANMKLKDCCMKGKRMGLKARIYKSDNLFRACRDAVKYNIPKLAHRCHWIAQTCCENKALRRYYIRHKRPS